MTITQNTTIDIDGVTYRAEPAIVEKTQLGREDHGILQVGLHVNYHSGGSTFIGGLLDESNFARYVIGINDAFGGRYGFWETIPGRTIYVLFTLDDRTRHGMDSLGFVPMNTDRFVLWRQLLLAQAVGE